MRLVPRTTTGTISFYAIRAQKWVEHAHEIGISVDEAETIGTLAAEAKALNLAQDQAMAQARAATYALDIKLKELRTRGSAAVSKIRAAAEVDGGTGIYIKALIDPPRGPGLSPSPGRPEHFTSALLQNGEVVISWDCWNPDGGGTIYEVRRAIDAGGRDFVHIGHAGPDKTYIDRTIPRGTPTVLYMVTPLRGSQRGPANIHTVNFGSVDAGRALRAA